METDGLIKRQTIIGYDDEKKIYKVEASEVCPLGGNEAIDTLTGYGGYLDVDDLAYLNDFRDMGRAWTIGEENLLENNRP